MTALGAASLLGAGPSAVAQDPVDPPEAPPAVPVRPPVPPPAPPAADPAPDPTATGPATAGPGTAGPVEWFPLRRNVDGTEVRLGCTFRSRGSSGGYECGGHHDRWALDLIADAGTPVHAVRAGVARDATGEGGDSGYGNVVRIDHGDGVETLYAHLSAVLVPAEGALVDEDTVIGLVGSTGSSSASHLHYEKRLLGSDEPVDPGPMAACVLGTQVSFPQAAGHESWFGLPWGAFTLTSDGTACATPTPADRPAVARPLRDRLLGRFLVLAQIGDRPAG